MSPSRRRAIGAVRGLASCEIRTQNSLTHYPRPRGDAARWSAATARGGSPPSRLAPYRHYTRKISRRITRTSRDVPPVRGGRLLLHLFQG